MTWGESLQCRIVRVGVSQCPTGGWRKRQGTLRSGAGVVSKIHFLKYEKQFSQVAG
jgi:hypothetical protein